MSSEKKRLISSVLWNMTLLFAGSVIFSVGLNGIVIPQGFITGGISGVCLLIYYLSGILSPGTWYFILNIPLFLMGWFFVGRRFFFYSLYGMIVVSLCMDMVSFHIEIKDPLLAILAGGTILGVGGGVTLHSLGSLGGLDIIGILLNQKFGIRIGTFFFTFNMILFAFSFGSLETDLVLYSIALSFVTSRVLDYVLTTRCSSF